MSEIVKSKPLTEKEKLKGSLQDFAKENEFLRKELMETKKKLLEQTKLNLECQVALSHLQLIANVVEAYNINQQTIKTMDLINKSQKGD